jgi:hypothetical protein
MSVLTGNYAVDVSRMTGIPWSWERADSRGPRVPMIDPSRLSYVERMRIVVALIGAHYYLDSHAL